MSISSILNIGRSALNASQIQLSVTSNNIANATTVGYNKQEVILEVSSPVSQAGGYVGSGVKVAQIKRDYDALIQNQIYGAQQDYGKASTQSKIFSQVEQVFNESQNLGLATPLNDFFNAWQAVADNPEDQTARNLLLQKSDTLVNSAQSMEVNIQGTLKSSEQAVADSVDQINALASQIAQLNNQISQIEAGSTTGTANDLRVRDQRDTALKDLNNLIGVSTWEDKTTGAVTVNIGMKPLVNGNIVNTFSAAFGEGEYTLQLDGQDITSSITKGEIGGLLAAHQDLEGNLHDLQKLVASMTNAVNLQNRQGFGLDGSTGTNFFNPVGLTVKNNSADADLTGTITDYSQLTMAEYSIKFNGGNYEVSNKDTGELLTSGTYNSGGTTINLEGVRFDMSGSVTDQDSFTVSPLTTAIQDFKTNITSNQQIAASGTADGLPGDNTNALAIADLVNGNIKSLGSDTFSNYYKNLVAKVGKQSQTSSDELKFADNFLSQLNTQRDSVSGVNLDEEASNLIIFQRAYQAAARLITTADAMYQTLLNMLG
jgi:flagellar hook-associated protein 1